MAKLQYKVMHYILESPWINSRESGEAVGSTSKCFKSLNWPALSFGTIAIDRFVQLQLTKLLAALTLNLDWGHHVTLLKVWNISCILKLDQISLVWRWQLFGLDNISRAPISTHGTSTYTKGESLECVRKQLPRIHNYIQVTFSERNPFTEMVL